MCANCGHPAAPGHWSEAGAADASERLRARFRRGRLLDAVLRSYGLRAHEGGLIAGIQIETLSGQRLIIDDLTGVWALAERLAGTAVDPLDARFLLEHAEHS